MGILVDYLDIYDHIEYKYLKIKEKYGVDGVNGNIKLATMGGRGMLEPHEWRIIKMRAKLIEWLQVHAERDDKKARRKKNF